MLGKNKEVNKSRRHLLTLTRTYPHSSLGSIQHFSLGSVQHFCRGTEVHFSSGTWILNVVFFQRVKSQVAKAKSQKSLHAELEFLNNL
jgi:hypothetical protein